jgi:hypothetical protein
MKKSETMSEFYGPSSEDEAEFDNQKQRANVAKSELLKSISESGTSTSSKQKSTPESFEGMLSVGSASFFRTFFL